MAREWHPGNSGEIGHVRDQGGGPLVSRTWSASRGPVLWDGVVDLVGSFPGFPAWACHARAVHLSMTEKYLLVEEATEYGFGLPIGWMVAAQSLTGVEPVSLGAGNTLRISYADGSHVRGFLLRTIGGRFGSRANRLADRLRSSFIAMGLAGSEPDPTFPLPPFHDFSISSETFAAHESEPVIWTGRAVMPIETGEVTVSADIWLTASSLIWAAPGRSGIYRIGIDDLAGITPVDVPGRKPEPAIIWSVPVAHHTAIDVVMRFSQHHDPGTNYHERGALLNALGRVGVPEIEPELPLRPWLPQPDTSSWPAWNHGSAQATGSPMAQVTTLAPMIDTGSPPVLGTLETDLPVQAATITPIRDEIDHGPRPLPRSTPLPWGDRVERADTANMRGERPLPPGADDMVSTGKTSKDSVRIWPPTAPKTDDPVVADPGTLLVRRPATRTPSTAEFLARRDADADSAATDPARTTGDVAIVTRESKSRTGRIVMRFRRTPNVAGLATVPGDPISSQLAGAPAGTATETPAPIMGTATAECRETATDGTRGGAPAARATATSDSSGKPPVRSEPIMCRPVLAPRAATVPDPSGTRHQVLAAISAIDAAFSATRAVLARIERGDPDTELPQSAAAPLQAALTALADAVRHGTISAQMAETHRQAISRTADTSERLRSLIDLWRRGYLSGDELRTRCNQLLGRERAT